MRHVGNVTAEKGRERAEVLPSVARRAAELHSPDGEEDGEGAAWIVAWDNARAAAAADEIEGGYGPENVPDWPEGELSVWALGRSRDDGRPMPYRIWMDLNTDEGGGARWIVEDITEPDVGPAPREFMEKTPVRPGLDDDYRRRYGFDLPD